MYRLHQRMVDTEGYVSVNSIRYSVPVSWIGRRVEIRETRDRIAIELDPRHIVTHDRVLTPLSQFPPYLLSIRLDSKNSMSYSPASSHSHLSSKPCA